VAADLRAGRIDAAEAARRLIEDVAKRRIGGHLSAGQRKELESLLADVVERDPNLSARLSRLAKRR
jgi:hypothetical protein